MSNIDIIKSLGDLGPYINDNGLIEIVIRGQHKRVKAFQKVAFGELSQKQDQQLLGQLAATMSQNTEALNRTTDSLNNVAKLQLLNTFLSGANLCATCAGFAIVNNKLDKLSSEMKDIILVMKQRYGVQLDYQLNRVLAEHMNMLDSRRINSHYSEEELRKLIDAEYTLLDKVTDTFEKHLSDEDQKLIVAITALASMLSASVQYFDEQYYFNHKNDISTGEPWHSSHDKWLRALERLLSENFVKELQDYGIFTLGLNTIDTDKLQVANCNQILSLIEEIKDNQTLIRHIDDQTKIAEYYQKLNHLVNQQIQDAIQQTPGVSESKEVMHACQVAVQQVGIA